MNNLLKIFDKEKISLAYFGVFSDNITSMLIDLSETYISKTENLKKLSKKASFLIAESFQNIIRHSVVVCEDITEVEYNKDFYQINIIDDKITISSANIISNNQINSLSHHIEHINSLNSTQLKQLFRTSLEHASISEKGGAGLGLIEIVRKSGLPIYKKFIPLNETYSIFLLGLEISTINSKQTTINLNSIEKSYKTFVKDDVLLLYKGDFSSSSNSSIIEILNSNFIKGDEIEADKLKNIAIIIEIMQNVSKHGKIVNGIKEGFFAIKKNNNELFIECSNYIYKESFGAFKKNLNKIKSSTKIEIDELYKKILSNSYLSSNNNAGLGLLEIARLTNNSFTFNFHETPEKEILYSIKVKPI